MSPQVYKVVSTYDHEISGGTIITGLIHSHAPHLGGMNGDVKCDHPELDTSLLWDNEDIQIYKSLIGSLQ